MSENTNGHGAGRPGGEPDDLTQRAPGGAPAGWADWLGRLRQMFFGVSAGRVGASGRSSKRAAAEAVKPTVELTEAEKAAQIRQIDPRERKFGYLGAALAAILALLAFFPYVNDPSKPVSQTFSLVKGKTCVQAYPKFAGHIKESVVSGAHKCVGEVVYSRGHWLLEMLIVLFFAVFIFVAVRIGRRSGLAFASLFAGLALQATTGSIIGLLFVVGGGWLMMRAWRVQRYGSPDGAAARKAIAERSAAKRAARGTGGGTRSRGWRRQREEEPPTRKAPTASKRYTPKAPTRRRTPGPS